ncbi:polyprenyl synthetase family protein [Lactobacillus sp. R2/2]|nr:polyprenyl synthetase family protein [Lactobacillus sp. R2/2]
MGEAVRYAFSKPGKQLRPSFVLLFGEMGESNREQKLINIAGSIEILHNATLIHDDIIDNSNVRRGRASVQAKYGKTIALYAGDFLFALSLQLLSENTSKITNLRANGSTMQKYLQVKPLSLVMNMILQLRKKNILNRFGAKRLVYLVMPAILVLLKGA